MIRNYIKIAWRNLKGDSTFSSINIFGLAIGLAITILLFMFVSHERSFDNMYANKDKIYRVLLNTQGDNGEETWANAPAALAPSLQKDVPEITEAARMLKHDFGGTAFIQANEENFTEKGLYWCDKELFKIFDFKFIKGQAASALSRPNTVTLSQSTAMRYFGDENPIGKTITVDNNTQLEVTGVYEDLPANSTLDCNAIASFSSTYFSKNPSWSNASFETYLLTTENIDIASIEQKIQTVLDKEVAKEEQWYSFSIQPLNQVHLYSATYSDSYSSRNGDIKEVRNLSLLAALILFIACINYMNLTTARSQKRTKDVGINKTLGASTKDLIKRFYIETGLITAIAILLGVILAALAVPLFNKIADKQLNLDILYSGRFIASILGIWILTTLVAGSYPALHLSRFSPKTIMSTSYKKGSIATLVRKGLVVVQFSASVILIIGVIVIYQQLQFMQNKNLGYNPENLIAISTAAAQDKDTDVLLNSFKALPNVAEVSMAQGFPGMQVSGRSLSKNDADKSGINIQTNSSDATTIKALELKLLAGKSLPKVKVKTDTLVDVILNKKAIDYLGYTPEEAIGKKVQMQLGDNAYIVGVVDNFNFSSLHVPIGAYAFHNSQQEGQNYLLVRFNTGVLTQTMETFEKAFKKVVPNSAFDYTFLDKNLERLYANEQRTARIGLLFSVLAILVASLGLFGLAAFTAEQRKKEIGIRKVLGASVFGITQLLSKEFILLVLLSFVIAFPLALWIMNNWLQEFAYRIHISWLIFIAAGFLAFVIALLTVSVQAIRAAVSNPIKSLRTE